MEYAIGLLFDEVTENRFNNIIRQTALKGISYMLDNQIAPHITIAGISTEHPQSIIDLIDNNVFNFNSGDIFWATIGVFIPQVIFAAPVLNEYLHNFNIRINELLKTVGSSENNRFYLPYNWIPHTTIALKMSLHELRLAFDVIMSEFKAFGGTTDRLILVPGDPSLEVIKTWMLPHLL